MKREGGCGSTRAELLSDDVLKLAMSCRKSECEAAPKVIRNREYSKKEDMQTVYRKDIKSSISR